jgi:hypothetical protein
MMRHTRLQSSVAAASKKRVGATIRLWRPSRRFCAVTLLLIIAFFAVIRFHLRDVPLERDEGEYAYAGQLILQGIPPYVLAYNMKLPGTYAAYALMMSAFGQTTAGIHLGFLVVNSVTIFLMYLLAAQLLGKLDGLVAAASYGVLSINRSVLGLQAHATHFVVICAVAGIILLLHAVEKQRARRAFYLFLSGLGLAWPSS